MGDGLKRARAAAKATQQIEVNLPPKVTAEEAQLAIDRHTVAQLNRSNGGNVATVKVRIAVAVDPTGAWSVCGWSGAEDDKTMMDVAVGDLEGGEARYFLTAELNVPEPTEATANVEP